MTPLPPVGRRDAQIADVAGLVAPDRRTDAFDLVAGIHAPAAAAS